MNYRHAFHAGNIGDVLKHAVLTRVITYLKAKPAAFRVIDTHAGIGRYDLQEGEARRTGEWQNGIARVLKAKQPTRVADLLAPWLDTVKALNEGEAKLRHYPGSPLLARMLLRTQDRLTATELHPKDAEALAALFAGDRQTKAIALDGWLALGSFVPPKERRGLVLIDPPFESEDEFSSLAAGLVKAWKRWPTGVYMAWYPIKDRKMVNSFYSVMRNQEIGRILCVEHFAGNPHADKPMMGSGLVVINPPWILADELRVLMPWLTETMALGAGADWRLIPLVGEEAPPRDA
ncbi:23S rRNA (adenine(2030)-N(6))-methyltransferase RlmJ [Stappia sp. ES.058]|uniref:23S rRNA (adenine(2030)-N(6))-methyltransferase RlmJ n=1 Tax=Stappia sp. ES.058 TaxID=1881061 RepID=UPI00087C1F11|nr:23S rRNA (adenine(2030)-N(6))-methyltransferase RlmJ [Stappia sp. ES.058]SDU28742.1 23S rRNA (adenine2030-N6)-methyltransferase [Stappia sp. ES.058]